MSKEKFSVSGMTCAACSAHVEKAVRNVAGVQEVSVSLLTNSMQVDFAAPATEQEICAAVAAAGYADEGCRRKIPGIPSGCGRISGSTVPTHSPSGSAAANAAGVHDCHTCACRAGKRRNSDPASGLESADSL